MRQVALVWAEAGWLVLPIKPGTKRRYLKGMVATTDADKIRDWWREWPDANVGVLPEGLRVVVFDIDGVQGEESLSRLERDAGVDLPPTYEERTGRQEGGRHLFYRLPSGVPALVSQYGNQHPWHQDVDVLFRGHVVVAGSSHHSGRFYATDAPRLPVPGELPALPGPVYDLLDRHGRVHAAAGRGRAKPAATRSQPSQAGRPLPRNRDEREPPKRIAQMLADTSDGRNARAFLVVVELLNWGRNEEEVVDIVLASPLGAKAREECPSNPASWLRQKVESARAYGHEPGFDSDGYWRAAHSAGLSSPQLRILDYLLGGARFQSGRVGMSFDRIGIGSAMSDPDDHICALIELGWLTLIETPPRGLGLPRTYRLTVPSDIAHEPATSLGAPPPHTTPPTQCSYGGFGTHLPGHDAFRRAKGSLHLHYPLLSLLGDEPIPLEVLAGALHQDRKMVERMATRLEESGVAVTEDQGLRLTAGNLLTRLNEVALAAGTHGKRAQAVRRCQEKAAAWHAKQAEYIRQRNEVGSEVWRREEAKALRAVFEMPANNALVSAWAERGKSLDDLVDYVVSAWGRRPRWEGPRRA